MTNKEIELIEEKYLNKYYHFLKFAEDEMLLGFKTKELIKSDWIGAYQNGLSDFCVGAERIIYSLLNGKGIGQPNSAPVGSDLFFEVDDAYIHIDLKTVQTRNISDFNTSIFVGRNQNSYAGNILVKNQPHRAYTPALPTFYTKESGLKKICLTYFITILYDRETLEILVISLLCMPNGELYSHYKERPLKAGKTSDVARFNFSNVPDFELLTNKKKRIKVIYYNDQAIINSSLDNKLTFYKDIYHNK